MFSREVIVFPTDNMQDTVLISLILMSSVKMGNAIGKALFCVF